MTKEIMAVIEADALATSAIVKLKSTNIGHADITAAIHSFMRAKSLLGRYMSENQEPYPTSPYPEGSYPTA